MLVTKSQHCTLETCPNPSCSTSHSNINKSLCATNVNFTSIAILQKLEVHSHAGRKHSLHTGSTLGAHATSHFNFFSSLTIKNEKRTEVCQMQIAEGFLAAKCMHVAALLADQIIAGHKLHFTALVVGDDFGFNNMLDMR